jgi:hypothetical protein
VYPAAPAPAPAPAAPAAPAAQDVAWGAFCARVEAAVVAGQDAGTIMVLVLALAVVVGAAA